MHNKIHDSYIHGEGYKHPMGNALKCKPSANCACAILLIIVGWAICMRGVPLVARGEFDTG